jgi:hypothetical protein
MNRADAEREGWVFTVERPASIVAGHVLTPGQFAAEKVDGASIIRKSGDSEEQLLWRISTYEDDLNSGRRPHPPSPQVHEGLSSA